MKRSTYCYWLVAALVFIVGLGGRARAQGTFDVRVVHLVQSAPAIDVFLNDMTPAIISNVAYENTSALATMQVEEGIRRVVDWYLEHELWWRGVMDGSYRHRSEEPSRGDHDG